MTASLADLAKYKIEYGTTDADLGPRRPPGTEEAGEEAGEDGAGGPRSSPGKLSVHRHWPARLAPKPIFLDEEPSPLAALPAADVLVVTWTVAELDALADVLTPGVRRNGWYRYARGFERSYLPFIREGAPARKARRLGSYHLTQIGSARVLCFKSELHLNQDGIMQPSGWATLPVLELFKQVIREVQPKLVITVGTAGAAHPEHHLGDVYITRAAKFRCRQELAKAPYNDRTFTCDFAVPTGALDAARELIRLQDEHLVEPDFAPPTGHYAWSGPPLPGHRNRPEIRLDGGGGEHDFAAFHPILSTDFFEFGTTENGLWEHGCALEMGDAVLGLAAEELGDAAPRWLAIRNASDPAINAKLPRGARPLDMQAHWAVWYYEAYGYWTSVNSAIATWAMIAGDQGSVS